MERKEGMAIDLDPPYMPTFQPIELFWQYGERYVSLLHESKRTTMDVHDQIRKGWYRNPEREGQTGGWRGAYPGKLFWCHR